VAEANGDANANRNVASTWETFTVVDKGNGYFAFKSHHGKYLVAESNGDLNANRNWALAWETFKVKQGGQNLFGCKDNTICHVTIKSFHGKYVSAEGNGKANANQNKIGPSETWTVTFVKTNKVTFKSSFGKYLVAEANGDANANRNVASTWETFTVVDKGNGNFAFKSYHGKYLVAESNGDLNANRDEASIWETFDVEAVSDCPVNNEKYVQIEGKCYYIDADAKTIDAAYSACSSMSAKLWEPHTLDTMNKGHAHLRKVVSKKQTANAGIWVGISDEKTEGTWYYKSTGEIFPFKNHQAPWRSNEPDNLRNGGEDCAKMNYGNQMEMYDVTCTDGRLLYAICELDGYVG